MQNEVKQNMNLLNEKGYLAEPGWGKEMYWHYNREAIPQELLKKLKEWDYHLVTNPDFGISCSISLRDKENFMTVMFMDYKNDRYYQNTAKSDLGLIPPADISGDIIFSSDQANAKCVRTAEKSVLTIEYPNYADGKDLFVDIEMLMPQTDKMVIATPFDEGEELFYYNVKVNCMPASGTVTFGGEKTDFLSGENWGVLDYGRGIWPKENVWYWGSASGELEGVPFGFNIGYGFGNLAAATENMFFYDGKTHKFDQIVFNIPEDSFMKPWTIVSNDGRFDMAFTPVLDRNSDTVKNGYGSVQHQVFGTFTGKAVLDDSTVLKLEDFWGFAEEVKNFWS